MGIGLKIQQIMIDKGMNANQVATLAGIPPMTLYSMIKRDSKKIDIDTLLKICAALDVNVEEVYYYDIGSKQAQAVDFSLSELEKQIIIVFRKKNDTERAMIAKMLDVPYASDTQAKKIG